MKEQQTGKLVIVTAPSGAGKTTIGQHLLSTFPDLAFSVSATTRAPRAHEQDGKDYYFYDVERFQKLIAENQLLEWEEVYPGKYYGTLRSEVDRLWETGKHIFFDIDVKGGYNLNQQFPERTLSIFISPPSLTVLEERLRQRHTETAASLEKRLSRARFELSYAGRFKHNIVNDHLPDALDEAEELVRDFLY